MSQGPYLAGLTISLVDYAVWPILNDMVKEWGTIKTCRHTKLHAYYERIMNLEFTKKALGLTVNQSESACKTGADCETESRT